MPRIRLGPALVIGAFGLASAATAQEWSPDGRWLAYVQAGPAEDRPSDWLLDSGAEGRPAPAPGRWRLWAIRVDDEGQPADSVLLAASTRPMTAPGWNRDGRSLAFGRIATDGPSSRFEVVVQDAPEHERVVRAWPIGAEAAGAAILEYESVAWSPDGRHLVAPRLDPPGLVVLGVEDGRVVRELPGGCKPSWSPSGRRLAFATGGDAAGLDLLDLDAGTTRRLAALPGQDRMPPAFWGRDDASLLIMVVHPDVRVLPLAERREMRLTGALLANGSPPQLTLERIDLDREGRSTVMNLPTEPFDGLDALVRLTAARDPQGESLYYAEAAEGEPSRLTRALPSAGEVRKRINPFQEMTPLGPLAVWPSPRGRKLAIRMGRNGRLSPPAILDVELETLVLIHPDDEARALWASEILESLGTILDGSLALPPERGGPSLRPTRLPSPGELDPDDVPAYQLRRLAVLGGSLVGPARPGSVGVATLDEAGLVFDYLRGDYESALARLDAAAPIAETPDERLRLLGLRAQIYLGLRRFEQAEGVVGYLRAASPPRRTIEDGPNGPILGPEESQTGWTEVLSHRLEDLKAGKRAPAGGDVSPGFDGGVEAVPEPPRPGGGGIPFLAPTGRPGAE